MSQGKTHFIVITLATYRDRNHTGLEIQKWYSGYRKNIKQKLISILAAQKGYVAVPLKWCNTPSPKSKLSNILPAQNPCSTGFDDKSIYKSKYRTRRNISGSLMEIPVYTVDAFTNLPFKGNPAAVCLLENVSHLVFCITE